SWTPGAFSVVQIGGGKNGHTPTQIIEMPHPVAVLATGELNGAVTGMPQLQKEYERKYGPGESVPNGFIQYWSMRIMAGLGTLILLLALWGGRLLHRGTLERSGGFRRLSLWAVGTPFVLA